jgi:integrase/recombinase XerD
MNNKAESTLRKYENVLRVKNYADNTVNIYCHYLSVFLKSFDCDAYHISKSKAIDWMQSFNYTSVSQQNQLINAIKLFYKFIIKTELKDVLVSRPRKEKRLPQVIDKEFLLDGISKITNLKHKSIISLAYSVGLRVSEVCNLKIEDIDSKRMIINVRQAKGNKDRVLPLSQKVLELLREYYKQHRPKGYLFNGQNSLKYSPSSCNKIVKKYFGDKYHFHQLRHSSFTSLLEAGTDLRIIQKIAGHMSSKTTEVYTHVSTQLLSKINLPV